MSYRNVSKPNKQEFVEFMKDHTNKDAAGFYGVGVRTISRWVRDWGLDYEQLKYGDAKLTTIQKDLILGSLLGDGCILAKVQRFQLGQKYTRKEYVKWAYDTLRPFSIKFYSDTPKGRFAHCPSWRMYTCAHSIFKTMRSEWYVGKQKVVPNTIGLNENILLHWYLHDGHNHQTRRSISFSTDCFRIQDVEFLIQILQRDLNIVASLSYNSKKQPRIYIGAYEYEKVIHLLKPLVAWECFAYKVDTSKVLPKRIANGGAAKLSPDKAKAIRVLFHDGTGVKKLTEMFSVTASSIYNVLNNETYAEILHDEALVSVVYNIK